MASDQIKELTAACLLQPGAAGLLRVTLSAMRAPDATPDLDALFGVLDPGAYADAGLAGEVATFLREANRPDLAHRWSRRADELNVPAPSTKPALSVVEGTQPAASPASPWGAGDVVKLDRARPEEEQRGAKAFAAHCDTEHRDQVDAAVAQTIDVFGKIDIVVNNAQALVYKSVRKLTEERQGRVMIQLERLVATHAAARPDLLADG